MQNSIFTKALETIAGLIEGQRIAGPHRYEVVWDKDHFVCRQRVDVDKEVYLIINLTAKDVNEGLSPAKWDSITSRLQTLISVGVIKWVH